jgi:SAM-dependent methyltransferase
MTEDKNKLIINKSNKLFDECVEKYGESSSAVKWDNQQTQYLRFAELIKHIDINDSSKSILDVGCGNGELYKFLNFIGYGGKYTGYDINEKLLTIARSRFKNIDVKRVDVLSNEGTENSKFDYVLMSGLFNLNIGQNKDWCCKFINRMYQLCLNSCSFNAISTYVNYQEEHMFYLNPMEIIDYCINNMSPSVELFHHKLPYNYTVTVYKRMDWKSI